MSYDQLYAIATQGLNVEKLRIDVVANNIANQHSVRTADGHLFEASLVQSTATPVTQMLEHPEQPAIDSIRVTSQELPPNKVYQPAHPNADQQGYVSYPGLSTIDEMSTLLRASRTYEANIKIINAAHNLYLQALSIGDSR